MGMLVSQTIRNLNNSQTTADLDSCVWIVSDLLKKTSQANYFSGFKEIDDEQVTEDERKQLQNALLEALGRNTDPRWIASILSALGSGRDPSLRDLWLRYLAMYLDALKGANAVVYSVLVSLDDLGEPVFQGASSRSSVDVERNIDFASKYLHARGVTIPW